VVKVPALGTTDKMEGIDNRIIVQSFEKEHGIDRGWTDRFLILCQMVCLQMYFSLAVGSSTCSLGGHSTYCVSSC